MEGGDGTTDFERHGDYDDDRAGSRMAGRRCDGEVMDL